MGFWDSSALLPLFVAETTSETVGGLMRGDNDVAVWWGTWVECVVAFNRHMREDRLVEGHLEQTQATLDILAEDWQEVEPTDELRALSAFLARRHTLKAADTLQLAAAFVWCRGETQNRGFVCLDDQLRSAAREEGFTVLPERTASEVGVR